MHNTTVSPSSSEEVATNIGKNVRATLTERGMTLEWLAAEIGIDVSTILAAFSSHVDTWLLFDLAFYLEVAPDTLIGADR